MKILERCSGSHQGSRGAPTQAVWVCGALQGSLPLGLPGVTCTLSGSYQRVFFLQP